MNRILSVAGIGVLMMTAAVHAQALGSYGMPSSAELFEQADANHDGVVSRDEFRAARSARFDQLDRNHQGFLTEDDLPRFALRGEHGEKLRETLRAADTDHDGKVSREEFIAAGMSLFDRVDANHDGVVDKYEWQRAVDLLRLLKQN